MGGAWGALINKGGLKNSMSVTINVNTTWRGPQVKQEVLDASERFLMKITKDIIIIAKSLVHVQSGTLRRSIKADRPSEVRDRTNEARHRDLASGFQPRPERIEKSGHIELRLAVSGTTFYAIYEELLHPYLIPAVEWARSDVSTHIQSEKI